MTRDEIRNVLLEIIKDIDEDASFHLLKPDQSLRDQLDLDSMDFLDIDRGQGKGHSYFHSICRVF